MLCIGKSTFDRLAAAGKIGPKPVRIGGALRWLRIEAEAWLNHRDGEELHNAQSWPGIWQQLNRNNGLK